MKTSLLIAFLICIACTTARAQFTVDAEANYIFSIPYNEVRIPSSGGTLFDLNNDLNTRTTFAGRLRLSYTIHERHVISALAAPLTIRSSGSFDQDVVYSGGTFAAATAVNARYTFNSYRLTYRYMFVYNDQWRVGAGLTGKIRDANIVLRAEGQERDFPDLGFVPLINFYVRWLPTQQFSILLEGDALGTRQGRAEDIFAGVQVALGESISVKGGYRVLEGGADVTNNYNFSFINYVALGIVIDLPSK